MTSSMPRRAGSCASCGMPLERPLAAESQRMVRCTACGAQTEVTEADQVAWRAKVAIADVRQAVRHAEETLQASREILRRKRE
jgi:hypothetical protein